MPLFLISSTLYLDLSSAAKHYQNISKKFKSSYMTIDYALVIHILKTLL